MIRQRLPFWVGAVPIIASFAVIAIGGSVFIGWWLDIRLLTSLSPNWPKMVPNTALGLIGSGVALWLLRRDPVSRFERLVAWTAAAVPLFLGLSTLAESVFNVSLPIDRLLLNDLESGDAGPFPGRMSFTTALALVLIGFASWALVLDWRGSPLAAQILATFATLIALLALLGYVENVLSFTGAIRPIGSIGMAVNTAVSIVLVGIGYLSARPDFGLMAILRSPGADGIAVRRLLFVPIMLPLFTGLLNQEALLRGWYHPQFGGWLFSMANVAIFTFGIWYVASVVRRSEAGRLQALDQLKATSERIRDLYELAPCGYHSVGPDGIVIAMNATELRWLGYEAGEVIGRKKVGELVSPESRAAYYAGFATVRETGSVKDLELWLTRKDGTKFPVLLSSSSIRDAEGNYVMSRTTLTDLTERKRAEAEVHRLNAELEARVRIRTSELAEANDALRQQHAENEMFVYSVSHDLRSPLVNLQGFSKELEKASSGLSELFANAGIPEEVRRRGEMLLEGKVAKSIGFIRSAVLRLSSIIDALLRLSRVGRVEYRMEVVDVARVVERIVQAADLTIREKGTTIELGHLPSLWGDRTAIEQAFGNLIGNALAYLDPTRPGRIEIGSLEAEVGGLRTYFVRDNGLGIAEAHQPKIFQVFQRVHPGVGTGEGLGLAIVSRVAERHGGRVWVESRAGFGSTFYLSFPTSKGRL